MADPTFDIEVFRKSGDQEAQMLTVQSSPRQRFKFRVLRNNTLFREGETSPKTGRAHFVIRNEQELRPDEFRVELQSSGAAEEAKTMKELPQKEKAPAPRTEVHVTVEAPAARNEPKQEASPTVRVRTQYQRREIVLTFDAEHGGKPLKEGIIEVSDPNEVTGVTCCEIKKGVAEARLAPFRGSNEYRYLCSWRLAYTPVSGNILLYNISD
jgi:hypothetical protein